MTPQELKAKIQQAHDWIDLQGHGYGCIRNSRLTESEECSCGKDEAILGLQLILVELEKVAA